MSQAEMIDDVMEKGSEALAFLAALPFDRNMSPAESAHVVTLLRQALARAQALNEMVCGQKPPPVPAP